MAILTNLNVKGLDVSNSYTRVENIRIKDKTNLVFNVCFYANKEQSEPIEIKSYSCLFNIDGDNPFIQAYEYLKTLDEFQDSEDV